MTMRKVGISVVLMVSILILSGGKAYSDDASRHCLTSRPNMPTNICRLEGGRILRPSRRERRFSPAKPTR